MRTKRTLAMALVAALLSAPALPLLAEDAAVGVTPQASVAATAPVAAAPLSPAAEAAVKSPDATDAPELPDVKEGDVPDTVPEAVTATTEVEVPKEDIVVPGAAKPDEPEPKYKWTNFALGFLGGAVVGSAAGILFLSKGDDGSFDADKAKTVAPLVGAGTGLVFGLAALFLGSTTPEAAKPPKVESNLPPLPKRLDVADLGLRLDLRF